jgi:hypothetical protein
MHQGLPADIPAHDIRPGHPREILIVVVFILSTSVSFFLIQYDRLRTWNPGLQSLIGSMLAGTLPAPEQYRIAMGFLAHLLQLHTHLRPNQSLPLIESVSFACVLTLLYLLFRDSLQVQNAILSRRLIILGIFLAAAQFPVLWIFPWERPETLPTAFCVAAIVSLAVRQSKMPFAIVCLIAVLLALGQALLRADVAVAIGIAFLLSAALPISRPRPRLQMAILGILCAVIGGAVQLYLQHVVFPNATYPPNVPRVQLLSNLNLFYPPTHIPVFLTAMLPFVVSLLLLRRHQASLDPSDKLVLLICLIYLPVWFTMGLIGEVRIFVPFLLLASPTIAKIWAAFLLAEEPAHL